MRPTGIENEWSSKTNSRREKSEFRLDSFVAWAGISLGQEAYQLLRAIAADDKLRIDAVGLTRWVWNGHERVLAPHTSSPSMPPGP